MNLTGKSSKVRVSSSRIRRRRAGWISLALAAMAVAGLSVWYFEAHREPSRDNYRALVLSLGWIGIGLSVFIVMEVMKLGHMCVTYPQHLCIENCGNSFWGAVAWEQTPGIDNKNPDATKRGRPTLGMPVLLDMKPVDPNKWSGKIYNSEDGQTYSSNISLASPDVLRVQGCVLGILCGGESWTRRNLTCTS